MNVLVILMWTNKMLVAKSQRHYTEQHSDGLQMMSSCKIVNEDVPMTFLSRVSDVTCTSGSVQTLFETCILFHFESNL